MWYHYLVIRLKRMNTTKQSINDYLKKHGVSYLPDPKVVYYAYSKGQVRELCTYRDASQYSNNVERVVLNQKEINDQRVKYNSQIEAAKFEWKKYIKSKHGSLDDKLFELCYNTIADKNEYGIVDEDELNYLISFTLTILEIDNL